MINIQGTGLYLKTFTRDEYHALWRKYVADPVMDPDVYVYDREKVDRRFDAVLQRAYDYPRVGIFLPDGEIIGELSFKRIDREKSRCELGIVLAHNGYKGRGYGGEAMRLAVDYAFGALKLREIYADTMGSNAAMRRILDAMGFEHISTEQRFYDMKNRWEDKLNFVLRRRD